MYSIARNFPDFFKQFLDLESKFDSGRPCFYFNNRPWSAKEIWEEVWGADSQTPT
jgi:hypothetical protein